MLVSRENQCQLLVLRAVLINIAININFHAIASHGFYLRIVQKTTPPNLQYLLQLNFQIDKFMLAAAKVSCIYQATFMLVNSCQIALDVSFKLCNKI